MIYSGIPHTTAALFLSGSFIEENKQTYIITDSHTSRDYIGEVGSWIWGKSVRILHHPGELLKIGEYDEGVIVIHTDLMRVPGNIENLRRNSTISIVRDVSLSQNALIEKLLEFGYRQSDYPGESATYRRAGSIIQIWQEEREYTLEYFDDMIESILESRGSTRIHKDSITLTPTHPYLGESPLALSRELLELLSDIPTLLISCEFLMERDSIQEKFRDSVEYSSITREGSKKLDTTLPLIETLPVFLEYTRGTDISSEIVPICVTRYEKKLREFLMTNTVDHIQTLEYKHLKDSFSLRGHTEHLGKKWQTYVTDDHFSLLADDIFGNIFVQNRVRKTSIRNLDLLLKIQPGDAVVHREHGIGRYTQILRKRIGLIEREYMEIEYHGADRVYLPMTELARITKYVGESNPELSNLSGKEWERTLSKTDEEIEAIAADILETDAKRSLTTRIPFGVFRDEEEKFQKAFAHTHTADQLDIIVSIREDMEGPHPMDRLIAGDVGFGKTEIAMNAVYKAVLSGVQVAVISPLLILAEEHRETFEERLGVFGVRVRSLTRMTHAGEVKNILKAMKEGTVDVIIGTHRLLSEDIRFRRLGLLIIDEEHRFGVAQKETIKKMKTHVDILSLSATPIPRSLHLALSGLKKISLLTTPPASKKPIDTIVARWDESLVKQAIETERARKGQIIILHNRIRSLDMIASDILELFPDDPPSIVVTHGQMPPDTIEDRILAFKHGDYDILLSTTIIENGVNFLGANTIIVSDAEEFGLAQLHQIRGRVGRKDISGVCYLLYRKYELTGQERERLMILAEHSALGSGYEIAMRDMQMRGTGDILGFRQSGKTKEVGISLYFQLLEEKIQTLKNGRKKEVQCKVELELSYIIGDDEFDSEMDKLSFFRDIESIETLEDLDIAESTFTTKDIADSMSNLFLMMRASIILKVYGVSRVSKIGTAYHFDFQDTTTPRELREFLERFDPKNDMIIVSVRKIKIEIRHWKDARGFLLALTR